MNITDNRYITDFATGKRVLLHLKNLSDKNMSVFLLRVMVIIKLTLISIIHDDRKETVHQAVNEDSVRKFGVKPGYVSQIIDEEFSELHANVITEGFFNRYSVERTRLIIPTQDSIRRVKAPQENDDLMFFVNISTIYVTGVDGAPDGCYLIEWGPTEKNNFIRCVQMKV